MYLPWTTRTLVWWTDKHLYQFECFFAPCKQKENRILVSAAFCRITILHASRVCPSFHDSVITRDHARAVIHPNEHSKSFKKADKHQTSSPWHSIDSIALHSAQLYSVTFTPPWTLPYSPCPTLHHIGHHIAFPWHQIKEHDTHRHSIGCTSQLHLVPIYRICSVYTHCQKYKVKRLAKESLLFGRRMAVKVEQSEITES